jgi:hypothetical protein
MTKLYNSKSSAKLASLKEILIANNDLLKSLKVHSIHYKNNNELIFNVEMDKDYPNNDKLKLKLFYVQNDIHKYAIIITTMNIKKQSILENTTMIYQI